MDVAIEDAGPCKKRIKITVPQAEVQIKVNETYARLSETVTVDGFRKGHVPRKLLERRFGEEVMEEVKQTVLSESSEQAISEHELQVLGTPSFDDVDFDPEKDCVFEITLEVRPEFELAEYKGLNLARKVQEVSDEELEHGIKNILMRYATLELQPDATVQDQDYINCDWEILSGDEMVASEKEYQFVVSGKRFGDIELEKELAEILEGVKSDETCEAEGKIPDTYAIEKWRGKDCVVKMTIKEIRRPVLPELNDEFAKKLDFDTADEIKELVKRNLQQNKDRETELDLERQLFDQLLSAMPFDLPEGVLKEQARNLMVRQQYRLRSRGMPDSEINKHLESIRDASEETADRNLKTFFILEKICEKEKIFVTETEVENRILAMAANYNQSAAAMRKQIEQESSIADIRAGMREDKTTAFLMENADISGDTVKKTDDTEEKA